MQPPLTSLSISDGNLWCLLRLEQLLDWEPLQSVLWYVDCLEDYGPWLLQFINTQIQYRDRVEGEDQD